MFALPEVSRLHDDAHPRTRLSFLEAQRLCNVDYANEVAFVAWDPQGGETDIVATASYYRDASGRSAEVAYIIRADWQGRGLGRALRERLFDYGKRHGIERFVAEVLRSNRHGPIGERRLQAGGGRS